VADTKIYCTRCRGEVRVPELGPGEREAIATLRLSHTVRAMKAIMDATGWDLAEAKRTALHLTPKHGVCHRCGGAVAEGIGLCPDCGSVNIDWWQRSA
jgi:hypothetical protein